MTGRDASTRRYSFATPVDLAALLEAQHIEFLDVEETRAIVIFGETIFNVEVADGSLDCVEGVEVRVFDPPAAVELTDHEAVNDLMDTFVTRVADWADTTVTHHD
jgi:hypothetical protein